MPKNPLIRRLKKGGIKMPDVIDVHDLTEEDVKLIQRIVELLREKTKMREFKEKEEINFAAWPLGVKGKLTRKEIYDYL